MIDKIILFICLFLSLVLLLALFLQSSESNYHYCYIDSSGELQVSPICRRNQCETLDHDVVNAQKTLNIRTK